MSGIIFFGFICLLEIVKVVTLFSTNTPSARTSTFAYDAKSKFIYASVNIPSNTSRIFGVFEPNSSDSNTTVFEIDYSSGKDVLTFPVNRLPLAIGNASAYCSDVDLSSGFDIEIELNEDSLIVRAKNSRKYILKKQLKPPEKFKILFFFLSLEEGPCLLPAIMSLTHTSTYLPQKRTTPVYTSTKRCKNCRFYGRTLKSNSVKPFTEAYPFIARSTTKRQVGRVNFATFKAHRVPKTTPATTPAQVLPPSQAVKLTKKIKKDASEIRGGWTAEINSEWSLVFFILFGIVFVLVVTFILFGLIVFALLQIRPSNSEKHVYSEF